MAGGIDFAKQTNIYKEKKQKKLLAKGVVFSLLMLGLVMVMWGGSYFYKETQEKKITKIKSEITKEKNKRDFKEMAEVLSISNKLNFVSNFSQKQKFWSGFLNEISGKTFPSIYFSSFTGASDYSLGGSSGAISATPASPTNVNGNNETITIGMVSPSLNDISKQIIAFKKSDKIESIAIDGISLEDKGLTFLMTLQLVPGALERATYEAKEAMPEDAESGFQDNVISEEELNNLNTN